MSAEPDQQELSGVPAGARALIERMGLSRNPSGGWFRQTLATPFPVESARTDRPLATTIDYLVEASGPIGALHRTSAEAVHFFHHGAPLAIHVIAPDGGQRVEVLGPDLAAGQRLQISVPGGCWKGFELVAGEYALIGEVVVPGWVPSDDEPGDEVVLRRELPSLWPAITRLARGAAPDGAGRDRPSLPAVAPASRLGDEALAQVLGLAPHPEGGAFRQLWESTRTVETAGGPRPLANTIHYLLTRASPVGHFHRVRSPITHFVHEGRARYLMVSPDGALEEVVLGTDLGADERHAFTCPAGWWKSSHLPDDAARCLISELVAPGFRYADHEMATLDDFARWPHLASRCRPFVLAR